LINQTTQGLGGTSPASQSSQTSPPRAQSAEQSVADQAQDKAQELAGEAQEKAQDVAAHGRAQLRNQLEQRSSQAAESITRQANDLRAVGQTLREQGNVGPADAAERLATYAERVGGYLRDKSPDQLLHDAEDLGRKRPWAAVGAGAALGLAASRFLKASSRERYAKRPVSRPPAASAKYGERSRISSPGSVMGGTPAGVPPMAGPGAPVPDQTHGV
jgi:hypothetical protein